MVIIILTPAWGSISSHRYCLEEGDQNLDSISNIEVKRTVKLAKIGSFNACHHGILMELINYNNEG